MKTKNVNKKLSLNKESIASLEKQELSNAKGGTLETIRCTTPTICIWILCGADI